ncbi:MAG: hypothetical protein IPK16_12115 [Anaerolineales bacterium]|nr:hypothetical protein [Anaerolineales bacterium]
MVAILLGVLLLVLLIAAGVLLYRNLRPVRTPSEISPQPQPAAFLTASISEFEQAVARDPQNAAAYENLSFAYTLAGRFDDAIAIWQQAAQANPGQAWPMANLGRLYESVGLSLKARDAYVNAANEDPQDNEANRALARIAQGVAGNQAIQQFITDRALRRHSRR